MTKKRIMVNIDSELAQKIEMDAAAETVNPTVIIRRIVAQHYGWKTPQRSTR